MDLLQKRAIEPVPVSESYASFVSPLFTVPKKSGGVRPVFNLKALNQYVDCPHFKMETIQDISLMVKPDDHLASIDLSDAFLHLPLHPSSRKYLRFVWQNRLFQFRTTPFGLNIAPFWFTKTTRLIVQWARQQGIRLSAYLDDWIIMGETKEILQQHLQKVLSCLRNLGWLVNDEKSNFEPSPTIEHLGFVLDTTTMQASLPGKKLRDIQRSLKQLFQNPVQTPRRVQSVIMRLQAATFAVFPARLYTRHLLHQKNQWMRHDPRWDIPQRLNTQAVAELQWWINNLSKWNG
ncbi:hypothetical protein G6F43_011686 [Rhizopus delemar]|nr:hypothetical protein G6F43_011686 [Rhizopus delemar]